MLRLPLSQNEIIHQFQKVRVEVDEANIFENLLMALARLFRKNFTAFLRKKIEQRCCTIQILPETDKLKQKM